MQNKIDENNLINSNEIDNSSMLGDEKVDGLDQKDNQPKLKFKGLLNKLILQLIFTILLGYTGIPALTRTNKSYGIILLSTFCLAVFMTVYFRIWHIFIIIGIQYFCDIVVLVLRIIVVIKGSKYSKKNK